VIVGAGGHAKVIIDILQENDEFELAGCTTLDNHPGELLGLTVLGSDEVLPDLFRSGVRLAFVALGGNRVRLSLSERMREMGFGLINVVSRRATVSRRARLGGGIAIMPGAVVNVDTEIADGAIINTGATIDHDCRIGRCAHIAPGTNLAGNVTIGEGAFMGIGSRVIPGCSVGPWSVVGAGAVVVRDLPGSVRAVGVPARVVKTQEATL
jgi:UDP-perosamine 4-acetyltransferase